MSHENVSSCSEPWFLLNLAALDGYENVSSDYSCETLRLAVKEFSESLQHGEEDIYQYIRDFSLQIYNNLSDSKSDYFVDKTPRYFFIIDFIKRIFPNAKFIFLLRHPLDILASYIMSFNNGSIKRFDYYDRDFEAGFSLIANGYEKYKNESYLISYEELVSQNNDSVIKELFTYLNLPYDPLILSEYKKENLSGSLGDKNVENFQKIESNSNKWEKVINTKARRKVAFGLLEHIDKNYLKHLDLNRSNLHKILMQNKVHFSLAEEIDLLKVKIRRNIKRLIGWKSFS